MPVESGFGRVYEQTDPHLTIYAGDRSPVKDLYILQGHIYLAYDGRVNPSRMCSGRELRYAQLGVNPEMYDQRKQFIRTKGI